MSDSIRPGLLDAVKTVLFGAMGVRRKADHERQTQPLNPVYLIIAGLLIIIPGMILSVRFLLTHPLPLSEVRNG